MKKFLRVTLPVALALSGAACGNDDSSDTADTPNTEAPGSTDESGEPASTEPPDAEAAETTPLSDDSEALTAGTFPATVETAFGSVTVESEPERVVALGWGDAETALALGVQPVGAADWLGFGDDGVGPWAEGLYDESPVIFEVDVINYEQIASLEPDLILDVRGSGDPDQHETLSSIATTVGIPEGADAFLTTQEQQVTSIAGALGRPEAGAQLLEELDAQFASVAESHPEWSGQTVSAATRFGEVWGGYVDGEGRLEFLKQLGFEQNPDIAALDDGNFYAEISPELLGVIDADLVVAFPIGLEASVISEDPLWRAVPAVADGRAIIIQGELQSAYSLNSTLSAAYALEELEPLIADAIGG